MHKALLDSGRASSHQDYFLFTTKIEQDQEGDTQTWMNVQSSFTSKFTTLSSRDQDQWLCSIRAPIFSCLVHHKIVRARPGRIPQTWMRSHGLAAFWFISKVRSLCRSNVSFLILSAKSVHKDDPNFQSVSSKLCQMIAFFVKSIEDHFQYNNYLRSTCLEARADLCYTISESSCCDLAIVESPSPLSCANASSPANCVSRNLA